MYRLKKAESVMEEHNIYDWSKLDGIVAGITKTCCYTPSMFGTFSFDGCADSTQATQKQRRIRRKIDPASEKRPITVTETNKSESGCSKVEIVFNTIKEVSDKHYKY